jgi:hypothetical protein
MSTLRRMTLILLPLGIPLIAMGEGNSSSLIEKVRQATAQYRNVHVAVIWTPPDGKNFSV